jgi:hypothetical protein
MKRIDRDIHHPMQVVVPRSGTEEG